MAENKKPLGDRIFRSVMRILPFDFRSDFGREMEDVFHEQRREVEQRGDKVGFLRLWWETITGIFQTAPRQHWEIFKQDAGYALRMMRKNIWIYSGCGSDSGVWNRSEHGDFQRGEWSAASSASLYAWGAADPRDPEGAAG